MPLDDILLIIEQGAYKVEKEKKMNKNEELKNVDTIIITRKGNTVSVDAYDEYSNGCRTTCHRAIAECSPDDIFDFNIGAKLAFDRLYEGYDMTPRSKKLYSGKILFINPDHESNEFAYGCSDWEVKDGLITSLGYANSRNLNLRILRNMPCSELTARVNDMYFPYTDWSRRNKVMYLDNDKT
jgi:hypothetical protein